MNKNILISTLIIISAILILAHTSAVKNVDLAWNAKQTDLEDCNGIVCQDVTDMYTNSAMYLFTIEPILITILLLATFYIGKYKE